MRLIKRSALTAIAAAALLAAGCGGDDEHSGGEPLSPEAYGSELTAILTPVGPELQQIGSEISQLEDSQTDEIAAGLEETRGAGRIILFGATGYTGRLTAEASVARGDRPVLAARTKDKVEALADELGGLETAVADVADPASVRALVEPGDVIVATVGPFARWGDPAAEAAIAAGATYLDSTGEPAFIRRVFERFGPRGRAHRGRRC